MKSFDAMVHILRTITPHSNQLDWGSEMTIDCPDCGADMIIRRNPDNGHLWVTCSDCGVKLS